MFKKISLISLVFAIAISFIVFIFDSMSETLNDFPENSENIVNVFNFSDNDFDDFDSNTNSDFGLMEEKESLITLEEELVIAERLNEFMSLEEVKNLTDEEQTKLERKIKEINLGELKDMSIRDFVNILRVIKN